MMYLRSRPRVVAAGTTSLVQQAVVPVRGGSREAPGGGLVAAESGSGDLGFGLPR